jgi:hypothetical protein
MKATRNFRAWLLARAIYRRQLAAGHVTQTLQLVSTSHAMHIAKVNFQLNSPNRSYIYIYILYYIILYYIILLKHMSTRQHQNHLAIYDCSAHKRKFRQTPALTTQADNHAKKNPTRAWKERARSRGIALQSRGRTCPTLHTRPMEASRDHSINTCHD